MDDQLKTLLVMALLLEAALKKLPDRKLEIDYDDYELVRLKSNFPLKFISGTRPGTTFRKFTRVMAMADYEAWLTEKGAPKATPLKRKLYLE